MNESFWTAPLVRKQPRRHWRAAIRYWRPRRLTLSHNPRVHAWLWWNFALALALALPAGAQIHGVGLPGVPPGFDRHTVPQPQWQGHYAEMGQATWDALRNACQANLYGTAATHDCIATESEWDWVVVHEPRRGQFYFTWWHQFNEGGTRENPLVIDDRLTPTRMQGFRTLVEGGGGTWQLGLFSATGFWGWPVWYDNRLPADHPVNAGLSGGGGTGGTGGGGGISCAAPRLYTSTPREALRCQYFPLSGRCRLWRGWTAEYPRCCPGVECPAEPSFCGDGRCDTGEDCLICTQDCGACPASPPVAVCRDFRGPVSGGFVLAPGRDTMATFHQGTSFRLTGQVCALDLSALAGSRVDLVRYQRTSDAPLSRADLPERLFTHQLRTVDGSFALDLPAGDYWLDVVPWPEGAEAIVFDLRTEAVEPPPPPPPGTCSPPAGLGSHLDDLEAAASALRLALERALAAYREWATSSPPSTGALVPAVEDGP